MKKALQAILIVLLLVTVTKAQLIFEENFGYTAGSLLNANGWTPSGNPPSTVNQQAVSAPGLTFTGYPSVSGNALNLAVTGEDVYKTFPTVTSGNVYLAFLMNVQSAQATGDYIIALSPTSSQTNYYARTHLRSSGNGYIIGLSKSNELSGGYIYGNTVLSFNTTYAVVVKHQFLGSAVDSTNDAEQVFVFPSTIPATEPATAEISNYVQTGKTDPKDLGFITLRQGSTTAAPALKLDGIRITKSWATVTDVEKSNSTLPTKYELNQNYPNPFNPSTVINYQLPEAGNVTLKVYDVLGNEVATLVNEFQQAGSYNAKFANAQLSSGVYFYKLQVGSFTAVKKMMLTK